MLSRELGFDESSNVRFPSPGPSPSEITSEIRVSGSWCDRRMLTTRAELIQDGSSRAAKLSAAAPTAMRRRAWFIPCRPTLRAVRVVFTTAQCDEFLGSQNRLETCLNCTRSVRPVRTGHFLKCYRIGYSDRP